MIKAELIDSKKDHPKNIMHDILNIIPFNNRYKNSYLKLAKQISDDYHVIDVRNIPIISNFLFYKEYEIHLDKSNEIKDIESEIQDIYSENTIYKAIMDNDKEKFIAFTERKGFDAYKRLVNNLYPTPVREFSFKHGLSLLELCCYHGAVDCFKFLRTQFNSKITETCLHFSFLGGNQEIISECLKYQKPDEECMKYAIISHNIDFFTFLMNEYNLEVNIDFCVLYNNLESFLVYFDQTNDVNKCFVYSTNFDILSLCKYFLSNGANVNEKNEYGKTALHMAVINNYKDIAELLLSNGANINEKDEDGKTALHFAAINNSKEMVELLVSKGANINEKDENGKTALHIATLNNNKEIVVLLLSYDVNINEKDKDGKTTLHIAAINNNKAIAELLLLHDVNANEKDEEGETAFHKAAYNNSKEIAELLISHGANINEKNRYEKTALHLAALNNSQEIVKLLLLQNVNINEKDNKDIQLFILQQSIEVKKHLNFFLNKIQISIVNKVMITNKAKYKYPKLSN
ncbi:ankyrin repeat protein, putative [Trichomonas vaginalis G3]|uniref:Ankyrin repeat protein, putative n=1 Tax=Trichomonas vaginalis (strain ATCC PRA-98 / G3) TaxID=412133 RepID=A2DQP5_TRIV3|nr:protein ubiquitination [Trichomonas vaginalis G3]EAY17329.1 ankyrin repeat protein, putative [Trichomonas vaginalis G3]KAI5523180.1 protein ubiquitination [Trichomonas vaginalis G3]|eukprot:XP_001329552.1 ankyrin repeat protein [Trichomonas vaginalis G3]